MATTKFQSQYVFLLLLFLRLTGDGWRISFSFISITLIPMQKPKTNHICLISIGQKRTFKSGHSRSKLKCCLTFSNSRHHGDPLRDQKPPCPLKHVCHESIPKQEANACGTNTWQVISFMKRGYLDTKAATPQTCPGSFSIAKPAFEQVSSIWGL